MKKFLLGFLLIFMLFSSCSFETETEIPSVESVSFQGTSVELSVGQQKQIVFNILPKSAVPYTNVEYSVSSSSKIIEISEETPNGCVITGIKNGNCVLIAKCSGFTSYLQVNVIGSVDVEPYIVTPVVAYEMKVEQRKAFSVSLYGGSGSDNSLFEFSSSNPDVAEIEPANNSVVVQTKGAGFSRITITHPKSKYPASVMIYSTVESERPVYITTSQNVLQLGVNEGSQQFSVSLVGSETNDISSFTYKITEGKDIVDIIGNNNYFSVTPLKEGAALLEISHPECIIPLTIQLVVVQTTIDAYIDSDNNFIVMSPKSSSKVNCFVVGSEDPASNYKFSHTVTDSDVIGVTQVNNSFFIEGKKTGKSKIVVSNENCNNTHEICVIIQDHVGKLDEHYITTSQNLIKTEVDKEIVLSMLLTGGNESDKNSFKWTVDDSSIIDVTTSFGNVVSRSVSETNLAASALITAKKVGIANIEVSHPKSSVVSNVKVKVYPKNTLGKTPVEISGSGIVKVLKGSSSTYEVQQTAGEDRLTELNWSVEDSKIATVNGNSLTAVFTANESGITKGFAESSLLENPHTLSVLCGTQEELNSYNVLYSSNLYPKLFRGDTAYVEVNCSNEIETSKYSVSLNDSEVAKVRMSENILIIDALKAGTTDITVSHPDVTNPLTFILTVSDEVSIEKPYYFTYDKFQSVLVNDTKDIKVNLVGADTSDLNNITWEKEESDVIDIVGNGESCRIKANKEGTATVYASSPKAVKPAKIIVYTANTPEELEGKVVLDTEKTNYLSSVGKDIFIKVDVNNPDKNRESISWSCDDISMVRIDDNYDNAYIRCLKSGNCVVTVSCKNTSLKIFISVKEKEEDLYEKNIFIPSILELLVGETKTINAVTTGLTDSEKKNLFWSVEDSNIVTIKGNEESCYLLVNKLGFTKITLKQPQLGLEKQIQVVAAKNADDLLNKVVMSLPQSYYSLGKGEELNLKLAFGSNKPSLDVLSNIKWSCDDSSIISVVSNGASATIKALDEGIATLNVSADGIINTLTVKIAVGSLKSDYYLEGKRLFGLINGKSESLKVSLFNNKGQEVLTGLSNFSFDVSDKEIIDVSQADNVFQITAKKTGQSYLTVSHPLVQDAFKILVYTADTEAELDAFYPLTTDKDHYLLGIGDSAVLRLITINDEKINDIKWSCSNASVCSYRGDKKSLTITAKKGGSCTFTATHPDSKNSVTFNVFVTEYNEGNNNISILTEGIIGLKTNDTYTTFIQTNLPSSDISKLVWSSNSSKVSVEGNGSKALITANSPGLAEITVKYNSVVYRTIVVYVCDSIKEVESFSAHNIDKRYSVIGIGDTVTLKPSFGKAIADVSKTVYEDISGNDVVSFETKNGRLVVTGKNEGIASFRVTNAETKNSYKIYIEVNKNVEIEAEDTKTGYLTATKTIYVLDSKDTVTPTTVSVTPVDISPSNYSSINWEVEDDSVVTAIADGSKCNLYANREGDTVLKVSSIYSSNILNIRIVVSEDAISFVPYIKTDVDTLEIATGETKKITCSVENLPKFNIEKFSAKARTDVCRVSVVGNIVNVMAVKTGQDIITISYDDPDIDDVNIVVSSKGIASDCIYLTTDNNYSVIEKNKYQVLKAELVGFEELNGENFTWTIENEIPDEKGKSVCSISGNGLSVVCKGLNPGLAKIKLVHNNEDPLKKAVYPLYMTVKVSDYINTNPVYISTKSNVVTIQEGSKSTVDVSLVNGAESENSLFDWSTTNEDIIQINAANNQCVITGLTAGVGRITVSHPSCLGQTMDIIAIVEPKGEEDMLYISSDSTVIEMSPNDSYKQLNVSLVGGTPEQNTLFNWNILSFESTIKNQDGTSNAVIELVGSQNSAIIKPKNEGVAIIRVSNTATRHYLDIKVIITLYNSLKFAQSSLTVNQFETAFVDVETPTGKTVIYESSNENIATVSGTNKKCIIEGVGIPEGKNSGTCVIRAHTSDGVSSDEIIVKVTKNPSVVSNYITTSANVVTLNTLDNAGGMMLSAKLNGTGAQPSDDEEITWTISDNSNKVISFGGAYGSYTVKGNEITIKPENAGEVTLIVHHEKSKNDKVIYISVEQNAAKLSLSETYVNMNLDAIYGLSCSLTGVAETEYDKIVWASNDSSICNIMQSTPDGTVRGKNCNIRSNAVGECVISCTYGSIVKYVSIFVKEEPSISIAAGNVKIAVGQQDVMFKVDVNPKKYYNRVQIESSSSVYATVEKVLDHEKQQCYIKVSGTDIEGTTTITAKLDSLAAKMKVRTSADVYMRLRDYQIFDASGKLLETVINPSNIQADISSRKVRVHYSTEPAGIPLDNKAMTYSMEQLNEDKFASSSVPFVTLSYGKEDEGYSGPYPYYFELEPLSCGYAVIPFINSDSPGVSLDVPICFSDETFKPILTVESVNKYSRVDLENGIINIANADKLNFKLDSSCIGKMNYKMSISSNPVERGKFGVSSSNDYAQVIGLGSPNAGGTLRSTEYVGTVTIKVTYPQFNGYPDVYSKTFIVNQEVWY